MRNLQFKVYLILLIQFSCLTMVHAGMQTYIDMLYTTPFQLLSQIQQGVDDSTIQTPFVALTVATQLKKIVFKKSFTELPDVLIFLGSMSVQKTTFQGFKVTAKDITITGFSIEYATTVDAVTLSLGVQWIAYEISDFAEVIYKDFQTVALQSATPAIDRTESVVLTFNRTYTEIPNISLFLLGVTSTYLTGDSINMIATNTLIDSKITLTTTNSCTASQVVFVAFVNKKGMCLSASGSNSALNAGVLDPLAIWQDPTKLKVSVSQTIQATDTLTIQNAMQTVQSTFSGFNGFDIRMKILNLKISASEYVDPKLNQSVETWGTSKVASGYWDSFVCQTNLSPQADLKQLDIKWWMYAGALGILILVILIIYCCCCGVPKELQEIQKKVDQRKKAESGKQPNEVNKEGQAYKDNEVTKANEVLKASQVTKTSEPQNVKDVNNQHVKIDINHYDNNDQIEIKDKSIQKSAQNPFESSNNDQLDQTRDTQQNYNQLDDSKVYNEKNKLINNNSGINPQNNIIQKYGDNRINNSNNNPQYPQNDEEIPQKDNKGIKGNKTLSQLFQNSLRINKSPLRNLNQQ